MRLHRHGLGGCSAALADQVSRTSDGSRGRSEMQSGWHSVRVRHAQVWDWCAHQEEVERHLQQRRRLAALLHARRHWKLEAAH